MPVDVSGGDYNYSGLIVDAGKSCLIESERLPKLRYIGSKKMVSVWLLSMYHAHLGLSDISDGGDLGRPSNSSGVQAGS